MGASSIEISPLFEHSGQDVFGGTQLHAAVKEGLPSEKWLELVGMFQMPEKDLAAQIGVAQRTMARRKGSTLLTQDESERVARAAMVYKRACVVLDGETNARIWLKTANPLLGGRPIDFLSTSFGAGAVETLLGRIEDGIFV